MAKLLRQPADRRDGHLDRHGHLGGVVALKGLPIAQYPEITPPQVQVSTTYTGATRRHVEQARSRRRIEQQVNGVENMLYMKSTNAQRRDHGPQVSFEVGTDLDMSNVLVQNRVAQAHAAAARRTSRTTASRSRSRSRSRWSSSRCTRPNGTYDSDFLSNYAAININDASPRIRASATSSSSAAATTRCGSGSSRTDSPSSASRSPDLVNAIRQQNTLNPAGQIGGEPAPCPGTAVHLHGHARRGAC